MNWQTIIVTNVIEPSRSAFAVREDNGEQVFIPPTVSRACEIEPSDIVLAKLVPNRDRRGIDIQSVPWLAPLVTREDEGMMDADEVKDRLEEYDFPVTADEVEIPLIALQSAHQEGKIVKIVVMPAPKAERIVMWAASMDTV